MTAVPTFYLYGEPHRVAERSFLHVELLADRSRPSEWKIRPHAHADLAQLFLITSGGGAMRAEDRTLPFTSPTMLTVPPALVHGFEWTAESTGFVLTLTAPGLDDLLGRDRTVEPLFTAARTISLDHETARIAGTHMLALMKELGWSARGHQAAVESALLGLLSLGIRALDPAATSDRTQPGSHAALVARFRSRLDQRFRRRESIAVYATALGTSVSALRAACVRVAAASPSAMLDERTVLEARRALIFSNVSVAEVAYSLGFPDPAYFSRFFTRHEGRSPREYRRALYRNGAVAAAG